MRQRIYEWATSPMCITESAFRALVAQAASYPDPVTFASDQAWSWLEELFGPPAVREDTFGAVRIIHIAGVIDRFVPEIWRKIGYVDVGLVSERLASSMADETIQAIVLEMNTPGGSLWGTPELADEISEASKEKPIIVHASNLLCSCGYYLAAGATAILSDPSANVGAIGVYTPLLDFRGMYEQRGLSVELVKTGELKGAGYPGTEWTPEQKAHVQERVGDYYAAFVDHVKAHRTIKDEYMTGGDYVATRALEYGFIDDLGSLDDAIRLAADSAGM